MECRPADSFYPLLGSPNTSTHRGHLDSYSIEHVLHRRHPRAPSLYRKMKRSALTSIFFAHFARLRAICGYQGDDKLSESLFFEGIRSLAASYPGTKIIHQVR